MRNDLRNPYRPPSARLDTSDPGYQASVHSPRVRVVISFLVGDSDISRSGRALQWGLLTYFAATFVSFVLVYVMFPGELGPVLPNAAVIFATQLVPSYVAAALSPARIVRHALAIGLPVYLGSLLGLLLYWHTTSPWWYINQLLLSVLAAITAAWLEEARRMVMPRSTGAT